MSEALARHGRQTRAILGIRFSCLARDDVIGLLLHEAVPPGTGPCVIVTANLDHVVQLRRNEEFRASYDRATVVTADGMPVYLFAKLRGAALPHRVAGADLVRELLPMLSPQRHRCFFVASGAATAAGLESYLRARGFASEALAFDVPPFGFDRNARYSQQLAERIRDHRTTHLFLGIGAPKSEIWTHRHGDRLGDCYVLNVGAGLDFFAGVKRRAPAWMRRTGLEWLWRFGQDPHRLFRRYFVDSWGFVGALKDDLLQRTR
jgi:N-acetylglucosaminyldiphosphoundecaprenol N-acetyl-beta-D-mannosaminyltransferase